MVRSAFGASGLERWVLIVLVGVSSLTFAGRSPAGEIILFTASTDYTGNLPGGGYSFPNDPTQQDPYLPSLSTGVTLSQASGGLSNTTVGPLDGATYGPTGFNQNAGGTTGFITSTYTFATGGEFRLVWEVANVFGAQGGDALATDNITLNGTKLIDFSGGLPSGFTGLGSYGTSGGVPGLDPSGGDSAFAWMDVNRSSSTGVTPYFDTSGDVFSASQLYSTIFSVKAGDTLSLDVAFLTNDGSPYWDYGAVALQSIPEPSSLVLAAAAMVCMAGYASCRALRAARRRTGP